MPNDNCKNLNGGQKGKDGVIREWGDGVWGDKK
jgi:hypothetical protein